MGQGARTNAEGLRQLRALLNDSPVEVLVVPLPDWRGPQDVIEGYYRITATAIEVEVTDPGEVLTEADFKDADAQDFAQDGRGAGLFLIRALSDEVRVLRREDGGTTVHVVKRLAPRRAAS